MPNGRDSLVPRIDHASEGDQFIHFDAAVLVVLWEHGAQGVGDLASLLRMDFGTLSPMLKRIERKGLVRRERSSTDERRVLVDLTPKGVSLRKRAEQMLGEFYCFLNMPLGELSDLRDRLHHFVNSAGPKRALGGSA